MCYQNKILSKETKKNYLFPKERIEKHSHGPQKVIQWKGASFLLYIVFLAVACVTSIYSVQNESEKDNTHNKKGSIYLCSVV